MVAIGGCLGRAQILERVCADATAVLRGLEELRLTELEEVPRDRAASGEHGDPAGDEAVTAAASAGPDTESSRAWRQLQPEAVHGSSDHSLEKHSLERANSVETTPSFDSHRLRFLHGGDSGETDSSTGAIGESSTIGRRDANGLRGHLPNYLGIGHRAAMATAQGKPPQLDGRWRDLYVTSDHGEEDFIGDRLLRLQQLRNTRGLRVGDSRMGERNSHSSHKPMSSVGSVSRRSGGIFRALTASAGFRAAWLAGRAQSFDASESAISPGVLSPNSRSRLGWDVLGVMLMIYDLITIPMYVGWDVLYLSSHRVFERSMFLCCLVFWSCDIFLTLNTGFVRRTGSVEMTRAGIAVNYMRGWFGFDVLMVLLDAVQLFLPAARAFRTLRVLRIARVLRAIRIFTKRNMAESMEEIFTEWGVQWLLLVASIWRTMFFIFLAAHYCSCAWYYVGRVNDDAAKANWLQTIRLSQDGDADSIWYQYVRAMYWVLGNLTAANVDNAIEASNQDERMLTLCLIMCSIFVVAVAIANITNMFAELSRMSAEAVSTRRQLQSYLSAANMPRELVARVVRFALYSHGRRSAVSLDARVSGLLSDRLRSEISRIQRSKYLLLHPLFALIEETHEEVFTNVCDNLQPAVYADSDYVFIAGTMAKSMYLTHDGRYKLTATDYGPNGLGGNVHYFKQPTWFAEISLFGKFVHRSTLQSLTFGDAFTLAAEGLMESVRLSPTCVRCVYRYAEDFLERLQGDHDEDEGRAFPQDVVPTTIAQRSSDAARVAKKSLEVDALLATCPAVGEEAMCDLMMMLESEDVDPLKITALLPTVFRELDEETGVYIKMGQKDERDRVMSAILNAIWLLKDRYDLFIDCQPLHARMPREEWRQWQDLVRWVGLTPEMVHAMLVFLVIRGLGKIKPFARMLPRSRCSPEDVVQHLMLNVPGLVPSVEALSGDMRLLVSGTLGTLSVFNLAQLLQGENTPEHVRRFQEHIEEGGEVLLKFYLLSLVSVMCGLGGIPEFRQGSSFMNQRNSSHVLLVVGFLQKVMELPPRLVYWGYIMARAHHLSLPTEGQEQLAIARLACLCRTSSSEIPALVAEWKRLSQGDRIALARHFLANGIDEPCFCFTFLPQYLANAKANKVVGLGRALVVLIDLLDALNEENFAKQVGLQIVEVDLKDLASFTMDVCSARTFLTTVANCKLVLAGGEVQMMISTKHKQRLKQINWAEDLDMEMSTKLRRIHRQVASLEATVGGLIGAKEGGESGSGWETHSI